MFVSLSEIADVSLGFKSLQNNFYYLDEETIKCYDIDARFCTPIVRLRDMDSSKFFQNPVIKQWLFVCRSKINDLRGTGALEYIEAMADQRATKKKQSGKSQTIREALEAQGSPTWYAPKARPKKQHIWLRKGINSVFSPYLFTKATSVDQRLNSIVPISDINWRELAAALTTSLFSFSLEINGSASMGAGVLEVTTTKMKTYPVLNIRQLSMKQRANLISLAESVWNTEAPIDWSCPTSTPGSKLVALDKWLLDVIGSKVPVTKLYNDLREACHSRVTIPSYKRKKIKKKQQYNIETVAQGITKIVGVQVQSHNFPDDFIENGELDIHLTFDRSSLRSIMILPLMDLYEINIINSNGESVFMESYSRPVSESIIRSLLWGRSTFSVKDDRDLMDMAVTNFMNFILDIEKKIDEMVTESALGTGYEMRLKDEVYKQLGIHPLAGSKELPSEITFLAS